MTANSHEELLQAGIKALQAQGFRVIRLDRRSVPDAIAIKDSGVMAIEADTTPTSVWLTRQKYSTEEPYYDEIITITQPYSEHYHTKETYLKALQLRKEGKSIREIRRILGETGRKPSVATIHDWIKGRKKPRW